MATDSEESYSLPHNILITNETSFDEYYNTVKDIVENNYTHEYTPEVIIMFRVLVWNIDNLQNKNIKITRYASNNKIGIYSSFNQTKTNK